MAGTYTSWSNFLSSVDSCNENEKSELESVRARTPDFWRGYVRGSFVARRGRVQERRREKEIQDDGTGYNETFLTRDALYIIHSQMFFVKKRFYEHFKERFQGKILIINSLVIVD